MSEFQAKYNELEEKLGQIITRLNEYQQIIIKKEKERASLMSSLEEERKEKEKWKNKYHDIAITKTITIIKEDHLFQTIIIK